MLRKAKLLPKAAPPVLVAGSEPAGRGRLRPGRVQARPPMGVQLGCWVGLEGEGRGLDG